MQAEHRIVEASAGSGKTFFLSEEVLKALESGVPASKIILMTFTIKATEDLTLKIREKIQKKYHESNEESKPIWKQALRDFPKLTITTIHGFCLMILKKFALEIGSSLNPKIETTFHKQKSIIRSVIKTSFETLLPADLEIAGFQMPRDLEKFLLECYCNDVFYPIIGPKIDFQEEIPPNWIAIQKKKEQWQNLKEIFNRTNYGSSLKKMEHDKLHEFLEIFFREKNWSDFLDELLIAGIKQKHWTFWINPLDPEFYKKDFEILDYQPFEEFGLELNKCFQEFQVKNPFFPTDWEVLDKRDRDNIQSSIKKKKIAALLMPQIYSKIKKEFYKEGYLSQDSLVKEVFLALQGPRKDLLCSRLKEMYQYILVDEFQDTDNFQWGIFEKIFLHQNMNFIAVGDPKQAIYGFRGADVNTYFQAQKKINSISKSISFSLNANYRSTPELIQIFNQLFSHFFNKDPESNQIIYQNIETQNHKIIPRVVSGDFSDFVVVPLNQTHPETNINEKVIWWEKIRYEIVNLKENGKIIGSAQSPLDEKEINWGDFLVLVSKNKDAYRLQKFLAQKGIPAIISGKGSLFSTTQAKDILMLFRVFENIYDVPRLKSLFCSNLFKKDPRIITDPHFVGYWQALFIPLSQQAKKGEFVGAFKNFLKLTLSEELPHHFNLQLNQRAYTNYFHILEILQNKFLKGELVWGKISITLQDLFSQTNEEENESIRLETNSLAVKIMTVHSSKGLESPIVFIAAWFENHSRNINRKIIKINQHGLGFRVSFNTKNPLFKQQEKRFINEEFKRLFYVALTRASSRLYLPRTTAPCILTELLSKVPETLLADFQKDIQINQKNFDHSSLLPISNFNSNPLQVPTGLNQAFPRIYSFSNLHGSEPEAANLRDSAEPDPVEMESPSIDLLPKGPKFGDLVHDLLEQADFNLWQTQICQSIKDLPKSFQDFWTQRIEKDFPGGEKIFGSELFTFIQKSLIEPLKLKDSAPPLGNEFQFHLTDIPFEKTKREWEFYLPLSDEINHFLKPFTMDSGLILRSGDYLTGKVDLIFVFQEKWFILDWKTNILTKSAYEEMKKHNYDHQAQIYAKALHEVLKITKDPRPIAGVIYYFLRNRKVIWLTEPFVLGERNE